MFASARSRLRNLFKHQPVGRRRTRQELGTAAEVFEPRVLLSASGVLSEQSQLNPLILNDYAVVQAADLNTLDNPDFSFFLWNPATGQNRQLNISNLQNGLRTNTTPPDMIDGNAYSQLIFGNFTGRSDFDDQFYWNPQTGENFAVISRDDDSSPVVVNMISPSAINGGEFQNVAVGDFSDAPGEELFFWDQNSGKNRLISITTGVVQTNVIEPTAINGEFKVVRAGNFDGVGTDDLFFWDPASGKNRLVSLTQSTAEGPVAIEQITTNFIADVAINGNDYSQLIISDYEPNGRVDMFFWNPQTGQNRLALFSETDGTVTIDTNCIEPTAINGNDFTTAVAFYTYLEPFRDDDPVTPTILFIDPVTGMNRRFSTPQPV